jgi:hypothetical protein
MHALAGEGVLLTPRRIGKILGRHPRTVERILPQAETPSKIHRGQHRILLTPEVITDVIAYIQLNRENRLKDYDEIIYDTGIICRPYTLRRVLCRTRINRIVAVLKLFLILDTKGKRLTFCRFVSK